jgi:tetratricopeptide (TPR) repeat protein
VKHPDNQEAFIALGDAFMAFAWVARGSGWASTVTEDGWRLMRERMEKAVIASTHATEVAPRDCRTWGSLLSLGTGASFPRERMERCFSKVLEINPYYYNAYETYANYLKPKWFGDEETVNAFVDTYADRFPLLTYGVVTEDFWDRNDPKDEAGRRARNARMADRVRQSPYLEKFEQRMKAYLRTSPWDVRNWNNFMFWMVKIGKRDETLAFAQSALASDPELKSYYPSIVLRALDYETRNLVSASEVEAYEGRGDVVALQGKALLELVKADSNNWAAWNQLAKFQVRQGRMKDARTSFEQIGTHWVPYFWDKASFEKSRTKALDSSLP